MIGLVSRLRRCRAVRRVPLLVPVAAALLAAFAAVLVVLAPTGSGAGDTGFASGSSSDGGEGSAGSGSASGTAKVAERDLTHTATLSGVVAYQGLRDVAVGREGILTRAAGVGTTVHVGEELLRIDEEPVLLLAGEVAAWRDLEPGVGNGRDVRQLEKSLLTLGHGQKSSTFPDGQWDEETTDALRRLQQRTGATVDGVAELGEVVFAGGDVRIAKLEANPGTRVERGDPLLTVSGTRRLVTVELDALDRELVETGMSVRVALPDGTTLAGTVSAVGSELTETQQGGYVYQVTVTLRDPEASSELALAPVTVTAETTVAKQALSVPVTAVVAVGGGGYAVHVRSEGSSDRVPVELGAWGDGFVQVEGELSPGDRVEVPR